MLGMPPSPSDIPGIESVYRNVEYLTKGGFKFVYKAKRPNGDIEALKLIPIDELNENSSNSALTVENSKRILREISILSQINCPFIVRKGSYPTQELAINDSKYIAYSEEYLDGETLHSIIQNKYRPTDNEIRELAKCILTAIDTIWVGLKTIHRDIKPLNIIKTNDIQRPFVLLDFGIAYSLTATSLTINPSQRIIGTPLYFAPEFLNPKFREHIDFRSDLYALGLTLYEYASGIHPFSNSAHDILSTLSAIKSEKPPQLNTLRNDLSNVTVHIIDSMIKKTPALRPSNIANLINELGVK